MSIYRTPCIHFIFITLLLHYFINKFWLPSHSFPSEINHIKEDTRTGTILKNTFTFTFYYRIVSDSALVYDLKQRSYRKIANFPDAIQSQRYVCMKAPFMQQVTKKYTNMKI